ncbi:hypothetical protein EZV62_007052 [Acer yangbiense]|uniref:non-specific serine/threonine protein kinase n=1 Tax=Acer yangbiense TaxID=1000413 RepID=A0A5C7I9E3_9ROSI|nr:hypothetical protein EZV62_007052 [Acer yangbiense]
MPASSVQGGSLSSPLMTHADCSAPSILDSSVGRPTGTRSYLLCNRIRVYPCVPDISFPKGFLFLSKRKVKNPKLIASATKNGDLFSIWNYDGKTAFEDIIEATEDFDIKYCIGIGGYGSVYRAYLPSGKIDALKKCMFLIYEYLERGSLSCALHNNDEAVEFGWFKRVNVTKGIAHALSHLSPPRDQTIVQDIVVVSSLAFACLSSKPKSRPTMKRLSQEFLIGKT